MAIKSEHPDATGFDLFDQWSASDPDRYNAQGVKSTWRSIKPGGGVNIGVRVLDESRLKEMGEIVKNEILADFPDGLDALITGVGTGGHITGAAQFLKQHWPNLKVFAVEPTQSPVISGGQPFRWA